MKSQPFTFGMLCLIVMLLTLFGCQNPSPSEKAIPTFSPTPDLTPKPTDIILAHPNEVTSGEYLMIEVHNQGNLPYIFYQPDGDRCLDIHIKDAPTRYFHTSPVTCDVLVSHVLKPGQQRILGGWDLNQCEDELCTQLSPAPPDEYFTSVTFYPFWGDVTKIDAGSDDEMGAGIEVTATFRVTEQD